MQQVTCTDYTQVKLLVRPTKSECRKGVNPSRFGIVAQGQDDQAYHHLFYGDVLKATFVRACPKIPHSQSPALLRCAPLCCVFIVVDCN